MSARGCRFLDLESAVSKRARPEDEDPEDEETEDEEIEDEEEEDEEEEDESSDAGEQIDEGAPVVPTQSVRDSDATLERCIVLARRGKTPIKEGDVDTDDEDRAMAQEYWLRQDGCESRADAKRRRLVGPSSAGPDDNADEDLFV